MCAVQCVRGLDDVFGQCGKMQLLPLRCFGQFQRPNLGLTTHGFGGELLRPLFGELLVLPFKFGGIGAGVAGLRVFVKPSA